jgi:phytoene dehydrogenase-like protein
MDLWLSDLAPAGRAAVGAAAVTWATRLWCALDWNAFTTPPLIGRDHWWDSPHTSLLALRGRAEVRTDVAHLVMLSGPRRDTIRAELSVVALVEFLRSRGGNVPGRVIGWWPDSGHMVRVDVEPAVLDGGVAAVARALLGSRTRAGA